ncbi:MAG: UDPGP type 1 family protein [bacterium]|nr:UDPGP type 1 family protein [bacterium]
MTPTTSNEMRERAEAAGQGHVFRFWDELDAAGRERLSGQVASIDFEEVARLGALLSAGPPPAPNRFEPPDTFPLERGAELEERAREARARGAERFAAGAVGYVLVAGGQGSRLGYDGPKGCFEVGPVTGRTLFGWLAGRIAAARERHGSVAPWYVMTSATNDAATRAFFAEQDHFGLGAENVRFFTQAMLPALDSEGRIVMSAPDELFLAPNGHGGTLAALSDSGCLDHARERGVETFSYFQVDSPLARPADTLFVGLHALAGAQMSAKVAAKRDADEKVGVLGLVDGKLGCIEYSDLPDDLRHAQTDDGKLLFRAGNIAAHVLERSFVEELTRGELRLPWHLARKEMPMLNEAGTIEKRPGVKFETFVFDALGYAQRSVVLEIDRALEFSPVKNADGADSPASCRADLTRLFRTWQAVAGVPVSEHAVEVAPEFAETEEEFLARMPAEPRRVEGAGVVYD